MAAGYDGSIRIDTKINTKSFNTGISKIMQSLKGLAGALGLVVGVAALARIGEQAIGLASDMKEVQNVVDTAFGSMKEKCEEFAETSIEKFGMSKLTAKQMSSTYMAMGRGMGIGMNEASDMAIGATGRIGDIASFYNKPFEEVDTMIKSIWTGETESLRRIGVVMTEINLQAFALSQGIQKNISDMTQAEKTQLRYAFVMSQTGLAMGDFEKTSGSWANQIRILNERWKEFLQIIGSGLVQMLTPALKFLNNLMSLLTSFAQKFNAITAAIFGKQTLETESATAATNALSDAQDALAQNTEKASKAAKGATTNFDTLHVMTSSESSPVSAATIDTGAMAALGPAQLDVKVGENVEISPKVQSAISRLKAMFEPLKNIDFTNLKNSLSTLWESISNLGGTVWDGIEWAYYNILVPLAEWTIVDLLPAFFNLLAGALEVLNSVIVALEPLFTWLWDNMLQPIAKWTGGIIISILNGLAYALSNISDWIGNHQSAFIAITTVVAAFFAVWKGTELAEFIVNSGGIIGGLGKMAAAIWKATGAKLVDKAETLYLCALYAKDFVVSLAKSTAGLVANAAKWVAATAVKIADTAATIASTVATTAAAAATWLFNAALTVLTSPITLVVLAIVALIAIVVLCIKHWDKIKAAAGKAVDFIKEKWKAISEWFNIHVIEPIKSVFSNIDIWFQEKFQAAKDAIINVFSSLSTWFDTAVVEPIKNVFNKIITFFKENWKAILIFLVNPFAGAFKLLYDHCDGFRNAVDLIMEKIKNTFAKAGDFIKENFISVFTHVKEFFKNFINGLLILSESFVNFFISGINLIIRGINKIQIKAPDWLGGKSIGFNIAEIPKISIPRLATGAVIPANSEFLAVLGDQKHGKNLEAPEGLIRKIIREELGRSGGDGGDWHIYLMRKNGSLESETIITAAQRKNRKSGKTIIPIGL